MALVVEDGTGKAGANSYVSVSEIKAFCEQRGIELPSVDSEIEVMAVLAFDFIESFRSRFKGYPSLPNQRTCWPRAGVVVDCSDVSGIPWQVKEAQCQATGEALESDLMPNYQSQPIVREKIDVLETQYAEPKVPTDGISSVKFPKVEAKLSSLLKGSGYRVRTVRG